MPALSNGELREGTRGVSLLVFWLGGMLVGSSVVHLLHYVGWASASRNLGGEIAIILFGVALTVFSSDIARLYFRAGAGDE